MIGKILSELFGSEFDTITVAKPVCSPARQAISGLFAQYGVKVYGIRESIEYTHFQGEDTPSLFIATVKVSTKQAVWAEYLLLRSKQFLLWSKPKHPKNEQWAEKHNAMPTSWNGKPLIEKSCKDVKLQKKRKKIKY